MSNFVLEEQTLDERVSQFWELDHVPNVNPEGYSINDKKVVEHWDRTAEIVDNHYSLEIPFKQNPPNMPNNREIAEKRLRSLENNLMKDEKKKEKYVTEIKKLLTNSYAEEIDESKSPQGLTWYLPHHSVFNVNKPDKLRVVFDCSSKFQGRSLNNSVLSGPDLANNLVGVLLRFREKKYAVTADIEAMFLQIKVPEIHRDALRFLFWRDGNPGSEVKTYRMTRHLFGGTWSSTAANYALKRTGKDCIADLSDEVTDALQKSFYVDDLLFSSESKGKAIETAKFIKQVLKRRGFNLTKWGSSHKEIIEAFEPEDRAKGLQNLDLQTEALPTDRALGLTVEPRN